MSRKHPYIDFPVPMILAHQGNSAHAPANTLTAFAQAVDAGADALETDIHWTKDGVVVTAHDETVDAVADGRGAIRDMTLAELRRLDFGYRFSPDGGLTHPFRGQGIRIPTLREVLQAFPDMRVNMDIKPRQPASLRALLADIADCDALHRVLVASFHHGPLRRIRRLYPGLATSASTREVACTRLLPAGVGGGTRRLPYVALQVPETAGRLTVVNESLIAKAHAHGIGVHVWTVDDAQAMMRLLELGVDGIVTNQPRLGVEVRNAWLDRQGVGRDESHGTLAAPASTS